MQQPLVQISNLQLPQQVLQNQFLKSGKFRIKFVLFGLKIGNICENTVYVWKKMDKTFKVFKSYFWDWMKLKILCSLGQPAHIGPVLPTGSFPNIFSALQYQILVQGFCFTLF